jgi:hypothetical protein
MSHSLPSHSIRKGFLRLGAALAIVAVGSTSFAADHRDGPAVQVADDIAADINDVYAFMDGGKLILGMTVFPAAEPNSTFSDAVVYQFHVNKHNSVLTPSAGTVNVMCTFDAAGANFQCWVEDQVYVTGPVGNATGTTSAGGEIKVFAGPRRDPFYFNLAGFNAARQAVITAAPNLMNFQDGCPFVDGTTGNGLRTLLTTPTANFFDELNTLSIVIEADPALFVDGTNPLASVWASTNRLGN